MITTVPIITTLITISLFVLLYYYVGKVKMALKSNNIASVRSNFSMVENITYVIVFLTFGMLMTKHIMAGTDRKKNKSSQFKVRYGKISYVNLSLSLVLLAGVYQMKFGLENKLTKNSSSKKNLSLISNDFKLVDNLSSVLLLFSTLSGFVILFSEHSKNSKSDS
jgi:hypothetical protein